MHFQLPHKGLNRTLRVSAVILHFLGYPSGHLFDTGALTLDFQAIVGHTLDFEAYMYAYVTADGDAEIFADFGSTFSASLSAELPGVSMTWQTVPEPASIVLLGMGGLMLRRRCR